MPSSSLRSSMTVGSGGSPCKKITICKFRGPTGGITFTPSYFRRRTRRVDRRLPSQILIVILYTIATGWRDAAAAFFCSQRCQMAGVGCHTRLLPPPLPDRARFICWCATREKPHMFRGGYVGRPKARGLEATEAQRSTSARVEYPMVQQT